MPAASVCVGLCSTFESATCNAENLTAAGVPRLLKLAGGQRISRGNLIKKLLECVFDLCISQTLDTD